MSHLPKADVAFSIQALHADRWGMMGATGKDCAIHAPSTSEPCLQSLQATFRVDGIPVSINPYTAVGIWIQPGQLGNRLSVLKERQCRAGSQRRRALLKYILE